MKTANPCTLTTVGIEAAAPLASALPAKSDVQDAKFANWGAVYNHAVSLVKPLKAAGFSFTGNGNTQVWEGKKTVKEVDAAGLETEKVIEVRIEAVRLDSEGKITTAAKRTGSNTGTVTAVRTAEPVAAIAEEEFVLEENEEGVVLVAA